MNRTPRLPVRRMAILAKAFLACSAVLVALGQAHAADQAMPNGIARLELLGSAEVTRQPSTPSAHFGGISGADFDQSTNTWYLLSDDRSKHAPARIYRARMKLDANGVSGISIEDYLPLPLPKGEIPDPEAIRCVPGQDLLVWSTEGDRLTNLSPSVRIMTKQGQAIGELALPTNLRSVKGSDRGPRDNLSFEGLAFTPDAQSLWVSMEAPLFEDGLLASLQEGAMVRMTRLSLSGGRAQQFAYAVDPIPSKATGGRLRMDNGVSEILAISEDRLLVVERGGHEVSDGLFEYVVRIYEAELGAATDVADISSLVGSKFTPMRKRLLLNLGALGLRHIDNIEAAAWGPTLADGRKTLLLASDDNFAANQVNQFILLAVEPRP